MKNICMADLVAWAFRDQKVDSPGFTLQERLEIGLGNPPSLLRSSVRVDQSLHGLHKVHPDAETLFDAVRRLDGFIQALVAQYGRTGDRPDWVPGAVLVERYARDEKGNPIRIYDFNRRFIGYRRERVALVDGQDIGLCEDGLRLARDVWEIWAGAMFTLCVTVGPMSAHQVMGPGVERRPWEAKGEVAA